MDLITGIRPYQTGGDSALRPRSIDRSMPSAIGRHTSGVAGAERFP